MRSRAELILAIAVTGVILAATMVGLGAAVLSTMEPPQREMLQDVLREQAMLIFWVWVLAAVLAGFLVARWYARYAMLPDQQAMSTQVMATANPAHRLAEEGPAPLRRLAAAVNQLAAAHEQARAEVTERVAETAGELIRERNRLAALMSELSVAVLVCNSEGRILLYNTAARQLFEHGGRSSVGLGRSVFSMLDRNLVAYALERVASGRATSYPVAVGHDGRLLRARIAAVASGPSGDDPGFVVTLEDLTRLADTTQNRELALRTMIRDTRGAVAAIRAAVENVLDYPDMEPDQQSRFLKIISDEATVLGTRLERSIAEASAVPDDVWAPTLVSGSDLLQSLYRGLDREDLPVRMSQPAGPTDQVWVAVDGYALQHLVGHLLEQLVTERGITEAGLRLGCIGNFAELDLTWSGPPLDAQALRAWTAMPPGGGAAGLAADYQEVVDRHGGEIWTGSQAGTSLSYVRVLLPLTSHQGLPAAPAPEEGEGSAGADDALRTYDFTLLTSSTRVGPWKDRPLSELSFTVFDTETTGLHPELGDEIISIGAVRIVNGRLLRGETFDQLVDPRRSVPQDSVAIHGIQPELLVGQPVIDEVLPDFADFADDTVLVGHNVAFDLQFFARRRHDAGCLLSLPVLDTLLLSPVVHPEAERHTLEDLAGRLGVNVIGRHTALGDALVTGEAFLSLIRLLADRGIHTVAEAQEASRRTYQSKISETLYTKD